MLPLDARFPDLLVDANAGGQLGQILRLGVGVAKLVLAERALGTSGLEAALLGKSDGIVDAEVVGLPASIGARIDTAFGL